MLCTKEIMWIKERKMKMIFFLLVLLKKGMNPAEGLKMVISSGRIILTYSFRSVYNPFEKVCCKFVGSECFLVANNRGHVGMEYDGRILISDYNREFTVTIANLNALDVGKYACGVREFPETFEDVDVSDYLRRVNAAPFRPKPSFKPAVWTSDLSTPSVSEKEAQKFSDSWRKSHILAAVLSVLVFAVISMTLLVYRLKTRKKKSTDKSGTCGSSDITLDPNGIVYSTVSFKPHWDPSEIYANLQIHSPKDTRPSSRCTVTTEESVEYSTILRAPA